MNEFRRREVKNGLMESETSRSSSFPLHITSGDTKPGWHVSHTSLLHSLLDQASAFQNSSLPSFSKGNTMLAPLHSRDGGCSETREPPNSNNKLLSRRVFDLEMPVNVRMNDEYKEPEKSFCGLPGIDPNLHSKKNNQLADLNEPVPYVENSTSIDIGRDQQLRNGHNSSKENFLRFLWFIWLLKFKHYI